MQLSEQDKKELQQMADEMDDISQKLRAFWGKDGSYNKLYLTKEFILLQERLKDLKKAFNEIPKI